MGPGVLSVRNKYRIHARNHIFESVSENELEEELTRVPGNDHSGVECAGGGVGIRGDLRG